MGNKSWLFLLLLLLFNVYLRPTTGIIEITLGANEDFEQAHEQHERTTATNAGQRGPHLGRLAVAAGHVVTR